MVEQYRKKPVVIDAIRMGINNVYDVAKWCGGRVVHKIDSGVDVRIEIPTLEGVMTAQEGDYIIQGVHNEFYPCKPDIFVATYEKVN